MAEFVIQSVAVLGTFAIHGTLLLGVGLLVLHWDRRRGAGMGNRVHERVLRTALLGAVLSTGLQLKMGDAWIPGFRIEVTGSASTRVAEGVAPIQAPNPNDPAPALSAAVPAGHSGGTGSAVLPPPANRPSPASSTAVATAAANRRGLVVGAALLALYGIGVLVSLGLRFRSSRRFTRLIAARRRVEDGDLLALVDRLGRAAGLPRTVRLTTSARLRSPVAFGWLRPEVCMPEAMLAHLEPEALRRVCAHEIAHLRGADPLWLLTYDLLVGAAWFQPLAYVARRRLRDLAEFRCDAWVVAETEDPVGMARTLVEVAEWLSEPASPLVAPAMAHSRSPLHQRITQILDPVAAASGSKLWGRPVLWGAVCAFGVAVPGVQSIPAPPIAAPAPLTLAGDRRADPQGVRAQLIRLEGEIADLHSQLATAWRLLEGRDRPEIVQALQATQARLQAMTAERQTLWAAATARQPR